MLRPLWILADPHGGQDADADQALVQLLDRAIEERADLFVLGDLFTGWLAPARFLGELERMVLDRFRTLRQRGARVDFVVGNRDYLVKETLEGDAFDAVYEGAQVIDLAGRSTLVVHGDRANPDDRAYHLWYALSRSRPATALLKTLPGVLGRRLVSRTERGLSKTNSAYKTGVLPIRALEELGREGARRGASRVLVGHFHHDRTIDVPDGVPVVIAPGWFEHRRVLAARADGSLVSTPLVR